MSEPVGKTHEHNFLYVVSFCNPGDSGGFEWFYWLENALEYFDHLVHWEWQRVRLIKWNVTAVLDSDIDWLENEADALKEWRA